jgi:hypothetical protein
LGPTKPAAAAKAASVAERIRRRTFIFDTVPSVVGKEFTGPAASII